MILKGSQRGGSRQLACHLLKTEENEHVEVHEVSGFIAEDILGALRESEAISRGTRCKQFLFHVALNPPQHERVRVEVFEDALVKIEERTGLTGQPRVVVFHEKEGRRHCHAVWSRIDAETMTAKQLSFSKLKLREVSKQLYLEHGWTMPRGLMESKARDPRNFSLAEWQQAKRMDVNARDLKGLVQECWAASDSRKAFSRALEERGLVLARGDRRGFVAMTHEGEPLSVARYVGKKAKEVRAKLGDPKDLPSMDEAKARLAERMTPKIRAFMAERKDAMCRDMAPALKQRRDLAERHRRERDIWNTACRKRWDEETRQRALRIRTGVQGLWDFMTGKRAKIQKQNEIEALWALQRDRDQREALVAAQLRERQALQQDIRAKREAHLKELLDLRSDRKRYAAMREARQKVLQTRRQSVRQEPVPAKAAERTPAPRSTPSISKERVVKQAPVAPEKAPEAVVVTRDREKAPESRSMPSDSTERAVKRAPVSLEKAPEPVAITPKHAAEPDRPSFTAPPTGLEASRILKSPSLSDRLERLRNRTRDRDRSRDSGPEIER